VIASRFWVWGGLLGLWWLSLLASVQAEQAIVPLRARVTDLTQTLSVAEVSRIEQQLAAFEVRKGSQLVVLMVPTTDAEAIERYAFRVAEQWKIGRKNVDDGALLLIAKNDRALRIEVGYGLEGVLPDAVCKRIIDEIIAPRFRAQDYAGGIEAGLAKMMALIEGEALPPAPSSVPNSSAPSLEGFLPQLLVMTVVLGLFLRLFGGRWFSVLATGVVMTLLAWWVLGALLSALLAGLLAIFINLGLIWGLFSSHRNSSGGNGGGGGFGGGGGGFGGGGASGRW